MVKKRQRRLLGFDEKVLAFYALGQSTCEIQSHRSVAIVRETRNGVRPISGAQNEATAMAFGGPRSSCVRPGAHSPILCFDALVVKSREEDGPVKSKAIYLALGINLKGEKELLGMWIAEHEGAKFWLGVFNELKSRGVEDCFVACVDGLKGLPEAIEAVFPRTQIQLCLV